MRKWARPTGAVGSDEIANGSISGSDIALGAVTAGIVAADAIGNSEIAPGAVGSSELADDTVQSADILDGTIAAGDIAQAVWSGSVHAAGLIADRAAAASSNDGFLYFATDVNGGTLYRSNGSSWAKIGAGNDEIAQSITMVPFSVWTDQPAAVTEFGGTSGYRKQYDLTDAAQVRLLANVDLAGAASAKLYAQYSTDQTSWNYLDGGMGPTVSTDTSGLQVSSWANLSSPAKADVYLRIAGDGGDGAIDPAFGTVDIQVR